MQMLTPLLMTVTPKKPKTFGKFAQKTLGQMLGKKVPKNPVPRPPPGKPRKWTIFDPFLSLLFKEQEV